MSKAGVMLPKVWQPYVDKLERENEELEATIERVRGLPEKWRKEPRISSDKDGVVYTRSAIHCADELEAELND